MDTDTSSATPTDRPATVAGATAAPATTAPADMSAAAAGTTGTTVNVITDTPSDLMHQAVTDELAVDIIDGRWAVDDPLTLEAIQERFAISRTVAREVAKYLESTRAVTIRRRVGLIPRPVDEWAALNTQVIRWKLMSTRRKDQLRTLTELRLAVEPAAAASAARNASMEARAMMPVMAAELRRCGEAGELDTFHELDVRFHSSLLLNSGNDLFASMADIIKIVLLGRVELHMYPQKPKPAALDAHDAVAQAVWKGDPDAAREAMHAIVDEVAESLELS